MAAERSGRGKRASFAVTCALMQRYVRENQRRAQAGNLARLLQAPPTLPEVAPPRENGDDTRTMQLFPARAAGATMAQPAGQQRAEMVRAPMTIFYGGRVMVVENVPMDQGKQLMQMLARSSAVNAPPPETVVVDVPEDDEPEVVGEASAAGANHAAMARKASLQRFLTKRKRRVNAGADPDHSEDVLPAAKKIDAGGGGGENMEDVPDALWLRL